jgi:hypothetical protein
MFYVLNNFVKDIYLKYLGIAGLKVWLGGSFIIKREFIEARKRPGGIQLGLTRLGLSLWWQGRSGMSLYILRRHVEITLRMYKNLFFIHIGGILGVMTLANIVYN